MTRLLALVALLSPAAAAADKPNVVVIVLGDVGQRDLGCYGSTYHRTPHIDALAKQGVRFTEATSASPVGAPSRAAILTGQYPARFGLTDDIPPRPPQPGDRLVGPVSAGELRLDAVTAAERFRAAGYRTAHAGAWHLGGPGFGPTDQGFDAATDDPAKWLAEAVAKPFFLHVALAPGPATPDAAAKFKPGKLGTQGNPDYAAALEDLDAQVGRVLGALPGNTVVVLTSSNGGVATLDPGATRPPTFNGPYREGKGYLYEGGLRVPLIVRARGLKPAVVPGAVNGIDVLPTVLELCGLPANRDDYDGVSLAKPLAGGEVPARDLVYTYQHYSPQGGRPAAAIRRGDWKLVWDYETGRCEGYDLKRDPGEGRNVYFEKPGGGSMIVLEADLALWLANHRAKVPKPNPGYRPNPQARDGIITMHARTAAVTGTQLRYEPLPHKDTLGYWTRVEDTAAFDFTVTTPGKFTVEVLQGCGKGSGGSEVELAVGDAKLTFTVQDTGGFQAFERREVGTLAVEAGRRTLTVRPLTKPGAAVMDLREVVLRPAK